MEVIVIHQREIPKEELPKPIDKSKKTVIGVATSVEKAEELINEYYGETKELYKLDIRDSSLEYLKVLQIVSGINHKVEVWLEWFTLDSID